jgi:hypothetical protein
MSNNHWVRDALSTVALGIAPNAASAVVFGTVAISLVISLLLLITRGGGSLYDQIGSGGISREGDHGGFTAPAPATDSPAVRAEREREIRQMLGARSQRLVRSGQPALDIDAEVARLLSPAREEREHESALVEEVRQLVVARNERRARQGLAPLDVETETARTLEEMDP